MNACKKNNKNTNDANVLQKKNVSKIASSETVYFDNMEEVIFWFDGLYENGDYINLSINKNNQKIVITSSGNSGNTDSGNNAKHTYTSDSKQTFAKWCNEYLKKGGCLKIGYDKSTETYWADSIPC
jgi:calcineurin-like phosphoesterase family protein